ncbi:MAG TPA: OsmC family protein [Candidatus Acidoferrales bacterium]|nr:OsmC family protein [Candidatus Acidoferrales bacterium]
METTHTYKVRARSTRVRSGVVAFDRVPEPIRFSAPPEFLGEPRVWTPEHFFVAALVSCYVSTFSGIADASKFSFASLEVDAEGTIEKDAGGWRFTEVRLHPSVKIVQEQDRERAGRLLEKAERSCLIARSISAKVTLAPVVKVVPDPTEAATVNPTGVVAGLGQGPESNPAAGGNHI